MRSQTGEERPKQKWEFCHSYDQPTTVTVQCTAHVCTEFGNKTVYNMYMYVFLLYKKSCKQRCHYILSKLLPYSTLIACYFLDEFYKRQAISTIQSQENQAHSGTAGVMAALTNIYKKLFLPVLNCLQSDGCRTGSEWDVFKQLWYM